MIPIAPAKAATATKIVINRSTPSVFELLTTPTTIAKRIIMIIPTTAWLIMNFFIISPFQEI